MYSAYSLIDIFFLINDSLTRLVFYCCTNREVLDLAGAAVKAGATTDDIDRIVHEAAVARGAYPSPLNYHGFPKR